MSLFEPVEIFAPNAQKTDPGAPGTVLPLAGPGRSRSSFWVAVAGFATYSVCLPLALLEALS